jgi:hypothetical protein
LKNREIAMNENPRAMAASEDVNCWGLSLQECIHHKVRPKVVSGAEMNQTLALLEV